MTSSDDMLYCYLLDIVSHLQPLSHRCQLSFKPICNWPVYLTASADELLAWLKQTSLLTATSNMGPFLATVAQNRIIANSLLTCTARPFTLLFHIVFHKTTKHYLRFQFTFQPSFPLYSHVTQWGTGIRGLMRGMATLSKVTRSY